MGNFSHNAICCSSKKKNIDNLCLNRAEQKEKNNLKQTLSAQRSWGLFPVADESTFGDVVCVCVCVCVCECVAYKVFFKASGQQF